MADPRDCPLEVMSNLACPYFMPLARLENGRWPHPARLPLGCGWAGHCTAPGHENDLPSEDVLESFCNLGYARGCAWAPPKPTSDAVRFAVSRAPSDKRRGSAAPRGDQAAPPTSILGLTYVCELDHRPAGRGELEFDLARGTWLGRHGDARVQKMAECFLDTYLRKTRS
jgi:hypothetical protein